MTLRAGAPRDEVNRGLEPSAGAGWSLAAPAGVSALREHGARLAVVRTRSETDGLPAANPLPASLSVHACVAIRRAVVVDPFVSGGGT